MNLLEQLNTCCRRLWRDESGVVLAFTVIVFLSLFVIACSVYAVGENIRQRIELQNAADAAAYSAAVVQADTLSRIAAINKAMAWTYVQMGREEMDYAVDVWLHLTMQKWNNDYNYLNGWLSSYRGCSESDQNSWIGWQGSGPFSSCSSKGTVSINHQGQTPQFRVLSDYYYQSYPRSVNLQSMISKNRTGIQNMDDEEENLINNLETRIQNVVISVLQTNTGYPNPDDHIYSLIASADYFTILSDENRLLQFLTPTNTANNTVAGCFPDGGDYWFNQFNQGNGIQRRYEQQPNGLQATWTWHGEGWLPNPKNYRCQLVQWTPASWIQTDTVLGSQADTDPQYYQTASVKAQTLKAEFFGPNGAIVVSVARKMTNPLLFMMADVSRPGLYNFFNPVTSSDGKTNYVWASAAARAGYHKEGGKSGEYWTQDSDGWLSNSNNLSQTDWDGELIPLQPVQTAQQLWNSSTWKPLFGSASTVTTLGSIAGGAAPTANEKFLH